jgi:hypothetical protein
MSESTSGLKERADRPVDQAAGEDLLLGRPSFAFEEASRDLAGGVGALLVIDGEREPVLPRFRAACANDRYQYHGVVHVDQHSACRLAGDFARFERQLAVAPVQSFGYSFHRILVHKQKRPPGAVLGL